MTAQIDVDPRFPHADAARYLGLSPATLYNWRHGGRADRRIPFVRVGALVQYRKSDLDAFLEKNTIDHTA